MFRKWEEIDRKLRELEKAVLSIEGAAVISLDGLTMASRFKPGIEEDVVAALSSALLTIAQRIGKELGRGDFERALVSGGTGYVLLTQAGSDTLLACICPKEAKLGLVFYEISRAAKSIGELIERPTYPVERPPERPLEEISREEVPSEEAPPEEAPPEEAAPEELPPEERPPEEAPPEELPMEEHPAREYLPEEIPREERPPEERPSEQYPPEKPAEEERPPPWV